jgi:hypothetical protein
MRSSWKVPSTRTHWSFSNAAAGAESNTIAKGSASAAQQLVKKR